MPGNAGWYGIVYVAQKIDVPCRHCSDNSRAMASASVLWLKTVGVASVCLDSCGTLSTQGTVTRTQGLAPIRCKKLTQGSENVLCE